MTETPVCAQCGTAGQVGAAFCGACGSALPKAEDTQSGAMIEPTPEIAQSPGVPVAVTTTWPDQAPGPSQSQPSPPSSGLTRWKRRLAYWIIAIVVWPFLALISGALAVAWMFAVPIIWFAVLRKSPLLLRADAVRPRKPGEDPLYARRIRGVPAWIGISLGVAVVLIACGFWKTGDDTASNSTSAISTSSADAPTDAGNSSEPVATAVPVETVNLTVDASSFVQGSKATLKVETDGTRLTVNGRRVNQKKSEFVVSLEKIGNNVFKVKATAPGKDPAAEVVTIRRELTSAEKAQQAAVAKQRYLDQAKSVDYDQLVKSPDAYAGTVVAFTGQILQIQDDSGVMLVNVTDMGYGFWSDLVWVNYLPGQVSGAADDIVTFWGRVVGGRSYDTQIGGQNFVPEIDARFIEG